MHLDRRWSNAQVRTATTASAGDCPAGRVSIAARRPANVLSLSRHVPSHPGGATRSVAQSEARKRRASERHVVGCCEELAARLLAAEVQCDDKCSIQFGQL